jgi:hypothetical protein
VRSNLSLIHQRLYSPLLGLSHFFTFITLYIAGRTPWMGNQHVTKPLPTHRTARAKNKCIQTSMPQVGFEPTTLVFKGQRLFRKPKFKVSMTNAFNIFFFFLALREPFIWLYCTIQYYIIPILTVSLHNQLKKNIAMLVFCYQKHNLHDNHHPHWQNSPFWAIAFPR